LHLTSDETRGALEREVLGSEFGQFFGDDLRRDMALAAFDGPASLLAFLHGPSEEFTRKDAALCALLRAYQAGGPERAALGSLLLLALWPGLRAIVRSKRGQFREDDDLWGEVQWAFLETAWLYPIPRRPARVASNLKLTTLKRICRTQRDRCRHQGAVKGLLEEAKRRGEDSIASPPADPAFLDGPPPESEEASLAGSLLHACNVAVDRGSISDIDRLLIVATRLYGRDLRSFAGSCGIAYEMARKRRQRAESVVRLLLGSSEGRS
jgi:hypothetical protein